MEQAVGRGMGAFSERGGQASRRALAGSRARTRSTGAALGALVADFERRAWVPEALRGLVDARSGAPALARAGAVPQEDRPLSRDRRPLPGGEGDARARRPCRVFRDFTYPLGVGSFDQFAIPARAYVRAVERKGDRLEIQADVESVEKAGRSYKIVRGPFTPGPAGESDARAAHRALDGGRLRRRGRGGGSRARRSGRAAHRRPGWAA